MVPQRKFVEVSRKFTTIVESNKQNTKKIQFISYSSIVLHLIEHANITDGDNFDEGNKFKVRYELSVNNLKVLTFKGVQ